MAMRPRLITAKYPGKCRKCGGRIEPGEQVRWAKGAGTYHLMGECLEEDAVAEPDHGGGYDDLMADRAEAEYQAGVAEGNRYLDERAVYGADLAEQFEMEREMGAWNRGDDY